MSLLPQPPPDVPPPPPGPAALRSRKWTRWLWSVGGSSVVIVVVAVLAAPLFLRASPKHPATEAVSNARQVGLALFEFESRYGSFPDLSTIPKVRVETGSTWSFGTTSSNDYFRQLIAGNIAGSEVMFFARSKWNRIKPDNHFTTEGECLKKGDCAFTYFLGAKAGDNPGRPLVVAPMIPGTDRFDPKPYDGKAVILKMNNSVTSLNIDKDGHAILNGMNLMDPHHPIWDGHAPSIAWPDL